MCKRFVTGSMVHAYRYSPTEYLAWFYRKHRGLVNAIAACLILVAAVGAYSYINILQARNREREQRLVAEKAQASEAASRAHAERTGYVTQLALMQEYLASHDSAMANHIAWNVLESQRGWEWGYLLNRANPELLTVSTPGTNVAAVTISPDATLAATVSAERSVQVWDVATGKLKANCEGDPPQLTNVCSFSADGKRVAGPALDGTVWVWEALTGKKIRILSGHTQPAVYVEFSPDGGHVVLRVPGWDGPNLGPGVWETPYP